MEMQEAVVIAIIAPVGTESNAGPRWWPKMSEKAWRWARVNGAEYVYT